jgi:hypothetical protein
VSHDVYFGTNADDVNEGLNGTYMGNQTELVYEPNVPETCQTYYWRIDERYGRASNSVVKGDVWRFSTLYPNFNGDQIVDLLDFAILANQWNSTDPESCGDLAPLPAGDDQVNMMDMQVLTEYWQDKCQ